MTRYLYLYIFAERGSQTSQHDEDDHAGAAAEDDGSPHDGAQPKETKTEQSTTARSSNGSSWRSERSLAWDGRPERTSYDEATGSDGSDGTWDDGT